MQFSVNKVVPVFNVFVMKKKMFEYLRNELVTLHVHHLYYACAGTTNLAAKHFRRLEHKEERDIFLDFVLPHYILHSTLLHNNPANHQDHSNSGPLPQKSSTLPMTHHITIPRNGT